MWAGDHHHRGDLPSQYWSGQELNPSGEFHFGGGGYPGGFLKLLAWKTIPAVGAYLVRDCYRCALDLSGGGLSHSAIAVVTARDQE
jgi:hypothetical protein